MAKEYDLAASALSKKPEEKKPPKKEVKEVRHRKAGKGFIVEHHHTAPDAHPMEEHIMPDKQALLDHIDELHGEPDGDESAQPAAE